MMQWMFHTLSAIYLNQIDPYTDFHLVTSSCLAFEFPSYHR